MKETKTKPVQIRFTPSEYAKLVALAANANRTLSDYIRSVLNAYSN